MVKVNDHIRSAFAYQFTQYRQTQGVNRSGQLVWLNPGLVIISAKERKYRLKLVMFNNFPFNNRNISVKKTLLNSQKCSEKAQ